jgi:hypothetical protein
MQFITSSLHPRGAFGRKFGLVAHASNRWMRRIGMQATPPKSTPRDALLAAAALLVAATLLSACGGGDNREATDRALREAPAAAV